MRPKAGGSVSLESWVTIACCKAADYFLVRARKESRRFGTWEIWPFESGLEFNELATIKMEEVICFRLRDGVKGTLLVKHFWRVKGSGWTLGFRITVSPIAKVPRVRKAKRTYWPVPRRHRAI
jgi:hypothetical protein